MPYLRLCHQDPGLRPRGKKSRNHEYTQGQGPGDFGHIAESKKDRNNGQRHHQDPSPGFSPIYFATFFQRNYEKAKAKAVPKVKKAFPFRKREHKGGSDGSHDQH